MEEYLEFYNEALKSGCVLAFKVGPDYFSEAMGKGGLIRTYYFWSNENLARLYRDTKPIPGEYTLDRIPLDEFCTSTLDSLVGKAHIVTIALNVSADADSSYHRGIEGVREYLDHYRLKKDSPKPFPGFFGGSHESNP